MLLFLPGLPVMLLLSLLFFMFRGELLGAPL
jgi:hypothetical protein